MYIEEVSAIPSEALEILKKNYSGKTNYDGEYTDFEDMDSICELIRDAYSNNYEEVSSDYVTKTYFLDLEGWRFSINGNSYRKSQCICDEELDNGIVVINLKEEEAKKLLEKNLKKLESDNKWLELIENNIGDIDRNMFDILRDYKFPTKW